MLVSFQSPEEKCPLVLKNLEQIEAQTAQGRHVEQSPTAKNLCLELKPGRLPELVIGHQQLDLYSPGCAVYPM